LASALRLEGPDEGLATLVFDSPDSKVNVLGREVIEELAALLDDLESRTDISCLVLMSGKPRNFIAGADIDAIERVEDPAEVREAVTLVQGLYSRWERLPFPTIAAIAGSCMGGGTEWALASTYILIANRPDLRIGLPETRLGILPGWGGCTRLPRRVGLTAALDVILPGKNVNAYKAFKIGLADAVMPPASFQHHVRDFARQAMAGKAPVKDRSTGVKDALLEKNPLGRKIVFDQAGKQVLKTTGGNYPAPLRALEVVRTGLERGKAAGFEAEARGISELAVSRESKSLVHVFRLMEGAGKAGSKKGDRGDGGSRRSIRRAAVLGAGVMGGGIAQLLAARASVPVRLKDIAPEPLAQGMAHAHELFAKQVKRRRITKPQALENMNLLRPTLDYSGFPAVDLVIEAIVERLDVKQSVFAELSAIVPDSAILASNTSSLSIEAIGRDVQSPERVIGMHFFNPVDRMPLVEVVISSHTAADVTDSIVALCGALGKTPVVVKDGPGFLVNRLLMFSMAEALSLLEDGVSIPALDRTMKQWGMPMGPVTLTDEVGLDVATHVAGILMDAFGDRLHVPEWIGRMVEDGRLGAKVGKGFYRYEGRKRLEPDPAVYDLLGLSPSNDEPDTLEVGHRIVLPMLNEAARCLAEGVVRDAGDLDLAMIMGTGFPPFRGGLCRWADDEGVHGLHDRMEELAGRIGTRFAPSDAFADIVAAGGFYARYPRAAKRDAAA
jgi:3-hydroxyacyl-CoA dehydrogenase/enoyl-CoA hydratase/3-hydroxybutyryl-CoA epimerase